ncbi:MAG: response regulator, partial [Flavobacteriales bacterium]|nr:response regulator [Flavobacteriales bacterium]
MNMIKILWADDEIELLKPHIIYLESKGYNLTSAKSGDEALEILDVNTFDLIFLDENMPGLNGLETLTIIKEKYANIPVIMITKSEEESIMEEAIGSKISDYLIKPVNPNQILLAIKKNIDSNRLVDQRITSNYQQDFRNLSLKISSNLDKEEWYKIYKKLVYWELE